MKYIIEEHLEAIIEGAGAVGFIVIFQTLFLNGAGAQFIENIISGFCYKM